MWKLALCKKCQLYDFQHSPDDIVFNYIFWTRITEGNTIIKYNPRYIVLEQWYLHTCKTMHITLEVVLVILKYVNTCTLSF